MHALWYLFIPVLVDIRFLLHCHSVLPAVSEAVQSHGLCMSFLRLPVVTIFFSRFCLQMLNYSPISCFYLHYFRVSVNKGNPSFDPGVQRDAVSSVCTIGWGRKAMNNAQHPFLWPGKSSSSPTALRQLSEGGSLHRPHCQVSFQVPSLWHKSFYKAATYFMRGDQREPGEGRDYVGLYSSSAE